MIKDQKLFIVSTCLVLGLFAHASAQLAITELRTKSQLDIDDYFELTNFGSSEVDISGWQFDDDSATLADAAPLEGVSTIAPGESVVIIQLDERDPMDPAYDPAAEISMFRSDWGGLNGVQVGYHAGAGLGKGDVITLFDSGDANVLSFEYGMTMPEPTHAGDWAAGISDGTDPFETQAALWVPESDPAEYVTAGVGLHGSIADSAGDFGTPGFLVPEPTAGIILVLSAFVLCGWHRR